MPIANWKTQCYNVIQSLLFNNPDRVIRYQVKDDQGNWVDRASTAPRARRLYDLETPADRTCLETVQFVHEMMIPPGGRHVEELHIHPDAEELVIVQAGAGKATVDSSTFPIAKGDVIYIPTAAEHIVENDSDEMLSVLFINVPTREGLTKLAARRS